MKTTTTLQNFPCWALNYAITGDMELLSQFEVQMIDNYFNTLKKETGSTFCSIDLDCEEYGPVKFCEQPSFGGPCECIDILATLI